MLNSEMLITEEYFIIYSNVYHLLFHYSGFLGYFPLIPGVFYGIIFLFFTTRMPYGKGISIQISYGLIMLHTLFHL